MADLRISQSRCSFCHRTAREVESLVASRPVLRRAAPHHLEREPAAAVTRAAAEAALHEMLFSGGALNAQLLGAAAPAAA